MLLELNDFLMTCKTQRNQLESAIVDPAKIPKNKIDPGKTDELVKQQENLRFGKIDYLLDNLF